MELRTRLMMFGTEFTQCRADLKRRRQLAAKLATYISQADVNELHAVLKTYSDAQTDEIRQILCRQQAYRNWTASRTI
jgi:hypothetical protein